MAELFKFVDKQVGLKNTLIVLSADHGGPDTPGYLKSLNIPAGYIKPDSWEKEAAITRLKKEFNIHGKLIAQYTHPYLYLSQSVLDNKEINLQALEEAVVKELASFPGTSTAISSASLQRGNVPDTPLYRAVLNNFYPERSGDIYVVFEPNWFINDFDGLHVAATHGSPWNYDTYVPVVFAGAGLDAENVTRKIHTVDIAPTLSAYLGIKAPSGAFGDVLGEVFD